MHAREKYSRKHNIPNFDTKIFISTMKPSDQPIKSSTIRTPTVLRVSFRVKQLFGSWLECFLNPLDLFHVLAGKEPIEKIWKAFKKKQNWIG